MIPIRPKHNRKGFTLVELLIAMVVTSIVLTAVATLAYALGTVNDVSDDTSRKQAQLRYATLRISELIKHSKLICAVHSDDLAVWKADLDSDGKIDIQELVYIETEPVTSCLRLTEFVPPPTYQNHHIAISTIVDRTIRSWLTGNCTIVYTVLIPECNDVQFAADSPPWGKLATVSWAVVENGTAHQYQVSATLRGQAANLLDGDGNIVSDDD